MWRYPENSAIEMCILPDRLQALSTQKGLPEQYYNKQIDSILLYPK
jgi:hypothetical protein